MVEKEVLLYLSTVYIYIYFLLHVYGNLLHYCGGRRTKKTVKENVQKAPRTTLLLAFVTPEDT